MLHWWPFLAANSYQLSVPTIYVQNSVSFTTSFSRIIFINSLSPTFFHEFNIPNSFSRINLRIQKPYKKFVRICTTSFRFVFAKSVCYVANSLYYMEDVLFTLAIQKNFDSIILCLLCFMNWWYSWGVILSLYRIVDICIFFYSCNILHPYLLATVRMSSDAVFLPH